MYTHVSVVQAYKFSIKMHVNIEIETCARAINLQQFYASYSALFREIVHIFV